MFTHLFLGDTFLKPYYLYKIVNKVNGKLYIGITKDPAKRKARHFSKTGHSAFSIVRTAIDKYGKENFSFEVICIGEKDYILYLEIKAITAYKTQDKKFGYNVKPGGQAGGGYKAGGSKSDKPVFVSGWWFPNRRTAVKALNLKLSIYKNRQRRNTLGDVVQTYEVKPNGGVIKFNRPYRYIGGFWFPSFSIAAIYLKKSYSVLVARHARGDCEEYVPDNRGRNQEGPNNVMFGIDPADHPSSISVVVEGITYNSIKEATAATGYSKYIINKRIKENHKDFKYA